MISKMILFCLYLSTFALCLEGKVSITTNFGDIYPIGWNENTDCRRLSDSMTDTWPRFYGFVKSSSQVGEGQKNSTTAQEEDRFLLINSESGELWLYDILVSFASERLLHWGPDSSRVLLRDRWPQLFKNGQLGLKADDFSLPLGMVSVQDTKSDSYLLFYQIDWDHKVMRGVLLNTLTNQTAEFEGVKLQLNLNLTAQARLDENKYRSPMPLSTYPPQPNRLYVGIRIDSVDDTGDLVEDIALIELELPIDQLLGTDDTEETNGNSTTIASPSPTIARQVNSRGNFCFESTYPTDVITLSTKPCAGKWWYNWFHDGIVLKDKLFLFENSKVIVIDQALLHTLDQPYDAIKFPIDSWINCPVE